jgi:hypothetical protein
MKSIHTTHTSLIRQSWRWESEEFNITEKSFLWKLLSLASTSSVRQLSVSSFSLLIFSSDVVSLGPIILTWYASKPENMAKNREFLKKAFQIEMKYPSTSPQEKSLADLYDAKIKKSEQEENK